MEYIYTHNKKRKTQWIYTGNFKSSDTAKLTSEQKSKVVHDAIRAPSNCEIILQ